MGSWERVSASASARRVPRGRSTTPTRCTTTVVDQGPAQLKFGFYFSPYQNNTVYDFYVNGAFDFYGPQTGVGSGFDLADFLMGSGRVFPVWPGALQHSLAAICGLWAGHLEGAPRLTLTLGLRYEYSQPKFDTQGRSFSYVPGEQSTRFPNAPRASYFRATPARPGLQFPRPRTTGRPAPVLPGTFLAMARPACAAALACSTTS